MAKIRKQTYTMSMFMEYIKDKDIRDDADVQRASGQWTAEQINELIVTVLTDGYIPPIFIGEDMNSQKWLIDGLQRSTSLNMFRYGNYKISSAIRNSVIKYRAKLKDDNENIVEDEKGDIVWEEAEFDIKNKTYNELPDELKKQFNSFQIDTIIFEECTMGKMSELIQVYNNHTPMNATQKAFTYISNYARDVRDILNNRFFIDYSNYTEKEKTKGVTERVVLEAVMCMFHLNDWKKQAKQIGMYLNEHSSKEEFGKLNTNLHRLEKVISKDVKDIFDSKDSFIWLTLFDRFTALDMDDIRFVEFLTAFKNGLREKAVDGILFDSADNGKGTKDKAVIKAKLHTLETLMYEYLRPKEADQNPVEEADAEQAYMEAFISENVGIAIDRVTEDMDVYKDTLNDLEERTVKLGSRLLDRENRPSLLAMTAYSYEEDRDLDEWLEEYAKHHTKYFADQRKNYFYMREDFNRFCKRSEGISGPKLQNITVQPCHS